jgi:hypothetical protein
MLLNQENADAFVGCGSQRVQKATNDERRQTLR